MRMKTAFTPFTLDESSAKHIQSVKCKFALTSSHTIANITEFKNSQVFLPHSVHTYIPTWGHAVAQLLEALRYKPEGRVFDCR